MDIKKYVAWFHDGTLEEIHYINSDHIVISLSSAIIEQDNEDYNGMIDLTPERTIRGNLHFEKIKGIQIDDVPFEGRLTKNCDFIEILDFEFHDDHTVYLGINRINFPPKIDEMEYNFIILRAKKIWWENLPDLSTPFWQ